ncbi:MAG: prevent-host-death protein [Acidobacteriaceae bacterium]
MPAIRVGVREFRERIASFLESDTPVAVTRRGETLGIYVPARPRRPETASVSELRAAADRLAKALADTDEDEVVAELRKLRRSGAKEVRSRAK